MTTLFKRWLRVATWACLVLPSAWGADLPAPVSELPLPANAGITMAYTRNFFSGSMNHLIQLVEDRIEPSGTVVLKTFEARDWSTQTRNTSLSRLYALHLHGYLVPPEDGAYRLYAHARGQMRVFLSSDADEAHAVILPFAAAGENRNDEKTLYNYAADPVNLRAGQRYFVRVLFIPGWHERLNILWARQADDGTMGEPVPITAAHLRTTAE